MRAWMWTGLAMLLLAQGLCAQQAPLQLAESYQGEVQVEQYWISEKLDGVRGRWDGQQLLTRSGYPIRSPAWFTQGWPTQPMDGELWLGRGRFEQISALVRTSDAPEQDWQQVRFMVFDLPEHGGDFSARVLAMRELAGLQLASLQPVAQQRLGSADELDALLERTVAGGGEGLMLHHASARYRAGRHPLLLKYKPFEDAEARVVGYTAGLGKYRGQVGALLVADGVGRRFRLGSGLSDAQRQSPPAIGTLVTYRFNGLTSGGLPRFARFLRVRTDAGLNEPAATP